MTKRGEKTDRQTQGKVEKRRCFLSTRLVLYIFGLGLPCLTCFVLSCPNLSRPILSYLVLLCLVLSLSCTVLVLFSLVLPCPVLSCIVLVLAYLVLSRPVVSYIVLFCPVLSCLVQQLSHISTRLPLSMLSVKLYARFISIMSPMLALPTSMAPIIFLSCQGTGQPCYP